MLWLACFASGSFLFFKNYPVGVGCFLKQGQAWNKCEWDWWCLAEAFGFFKPKTLYTRCME